MHRQCDRFLQDVVYIIGGNDEQNREINTVRGNRIRPHQMAENNVKEVHVTPMLKCIQINTKKRKQQEKAGKGIFLMINISVSQNECPND